MRRAVGVGAITALVLALASSLACAASLGFGAARPDLASELMLRLFGETSDTTATFAAQSGDRSSESPLRDLALQVRAMAAKPSLNQDANGSPAIEQRIAVANLSGVGASYLAQAVNAGLLSTGVRFAAPGQSHEPRATPLDSGSALFTAAYQPVSPVPDVSPAPGILAFDEASARESAPTLHDAPLGGDSDGRPAAQGLRLNVSAAYERATAGDTLLGTAGTDRSPWQLSASNAPLGVPNYAGASKLSLGAGLAVPVFRGLTLNLNYNAQRLYGGDILPGLENFEASNNSYAGRLTYNIPSSSSSLSVSAYQNRLGESLLPLNGFTQTGEDVNFTVKF